MPCRQCTYVSWGTTRHTRFGAFCKRVPDALFAHLFTFGQEFDVGAAAVETVLELDLVREDEGFALGVKDLVEGCRDGMVGGFGREDEAVVVLEAGVDFGFLDSPLSDIRKDLRGAPPAVSTVAGLTSGTSRNLFGAK